MHKVLLVPLLMVIALAGVQALSTSGATPGATVLQGGLASWSDVDARECDNRDQRIDTAAMLGHPPRLPGIAQIEAQQAAADVQLVDSDAMRNAAKYACSEH